MFSKILIAHHNRPCSVVHLFLKPPEKVLKPTSPVDRPVERRLFLFVQFEKVELPHLKRLIGA
jgi:hypothetical protein